MKITYKDLGIDSKLDVLARLFIPLYKLDLKLKGGMKLDPKLLEEAEAKAWLALTQVTVMKEKIDKYKQYMQTRQWKG
jgi:hypothetical protein